MSQGKSILILLTGAAKLSSRKMMHSLWHYGSSIAIFSLLANLKRIIETTFSFYIYPISWAAYQLSVNIAQWIVLDLDFFDFIRLIQGYALQVILSRGGKL